MLWSIFYGNNGKMVYEVIRVVYRVTYPLLLGCTEARRLGGFWDASLHTLLWTWIHFSSPLVLRTVWFHVKQNSVKRPVHADIIMPR